MKSKRFILMLGLLPLLASCSSSKTDMGMGMSMDMHHECPTTRPHVTLVAKGGVVNAKATSLNIAPDTIRVGAGCSFEIRFPRASGKFAGTTSAAAGWLNVTSTDAFPIVITVPEGTTADIYKYAIEVADFGTLDPRVKVIN